MQLFALIVLLDFSFFDIADMINYVILNPFYSGEEGSSSGIDIYSRELRQTILSKSGINVASLNFNFTEKRRDLRGYVSRSLAEFSKKNTIVEAPDARAFGGLIPAGYFTHIRLHCPLFLAQKYDRANPSKLLKFREVRQIRKADLLSSPSGLMCSELSRELRGKEVSIYPNPIFNYIEQPPVVEIERDIDILFLGRYQYLKGIDVFLKVVGQFGGELKVAVAGDDRPVSSYALNSVDNHGFVGPSEKMALLHRTKCVLIPSRFESFSMVAYEAISCGAKVITWPNTGFSEWADNEIVYRGLDDEKKTKEIILNALQSSPDSAKFHEKVDSVNGAFWLGIEYVQKKFNEWLSV
ncbi:D-inositol-3-phosphate glycosyltransferase [Microbulbifer sp. THAF38]|nr:D-inositol-3-phosphate glycosyltransferase [Microbulbifer sp. THAF38]